VVDFLRWPTFNFAGALDLYPHPDFFSSGIGTSIFFSTPLLVIFLSSPQGKTSHIWLRNTLWITVALMLITVLLYCTTGWVQVGSRYLFGFYPLLFLLLAQRVAPLDIRWIGLAGLSIFINLLLARTFWEGPPGKSFAVGCAAIVLVACTIAIIMLRRQKQQPEPEKITPPAPVMIPAEST
jgi:hypothetical protein